MMEIRYYPYTLELKHTFTISSYSRNSTPAVLVEISEDGKTGYGEISMPQYLEESVESAVDFLDKVNLSNFSVKNGINDLIEHVDAIAPRNTAAKAGIDIALHDLYCKMLDVTVRSLLGVEENESPQISFTLGIDSEEKLLEKILEAEEFSFIKIKLGVKEDRKIIDTVWRMTEKKIMVDVNQGWKEKEYALDMINFLSERNVVLVEQPMPKEMANEQLWLMERSPLPIFADEAVQRLGDLEKIKGLYNGINIKLMKCAGIKEAFRMIKRGREYGMQIMIGCMTETSCAIAAAAQISPLADYADLDGNLLINNDPFTGLTYNNGKIKLNNLPGLGVVKKIV